MIRWGNIYETAMILMQTILIIMAFIALYSETLRIPCCFFDGSLKQRSWNTDDFLLTFNDRNCFDFIVLSSETHWCFFDASVMFCWCFFEGTFMEPRWFECEQNWSLRFFFANLWLIDVSMLLHWIFVDESLKKF